MAPLFPAIGRGWPWRGKSRNTIRKIQRAGYPEGLKGEAIPLSARIVALVDVYDALRQPRVYKAACSHAGALDIITRGDERTRPDDFAPTVVAAILRVEAAMGAIHQANPG